MPTESSVTLNPGSGGAVVRTETVTPLGSATAVQQQVLSEADATTGSLGGIDMQGSRQVVVWGSTLQEILMELTRIRVGISILSDQDLYNISNEDESQ